MSSPQKHFVWGAGGVGKSHLVLKLAFDKAESESTLVLTLDPSHRLFELTKELPPDAIRFETLALRAESLFDELDRRSPAKPHIRKLYLEMVKGLQHFREYLQLIQLCDIIEKSQAQQIIIDTPPFQETGGLIRSMQTLHSFFQQTLIQWALKTSQLSILQFGFKRLFELTRVFVGKRASEAVFDLLEWMTHHTERFQRATQHLSDLLSSPQTHHHFVVTPETSPLFFEQIRLQFKSDQNIHFLMNRSCWLYPHKEAKDSFSLEMKRQFDLESLQLTRIEKLFPTAKGDRIPVLLMGDDTSEELMTFLRTKTQSLSLK